MTTATASNPMGLKRICTNCGIRFYDMNKRPIICPSCEGEFTMETKLKSRRGRASASIVEAKEAPPSKPANKKSVKEDIPATETDDDDDETSYNVPEDEDGDEDDGVEAVSLDDSDKSKINNDNNDDDSALNDEDTLDDIPDFGDEIDDDPDDDDTLLEKDDD
ncbi:MAG: TIGR02300 family protein [Alphaproteobacteria bacterium]|nr:TIGR02300 family protein [Alphaproteobacteria bacterium]